MLLKFNLFLLSAAISFASIAQNDEVKFNAEPETIGFNQVDQTSIKAHSFSFPHPIYYVVLVDTSGVIATGTRKRSFGGKYKKKGALTFIDVDTKEILHSRSIDYEKTKIRSYNGLYLESTKHETLRLNPRSRNKVWK